MKVAIVRGKFLNRFEMQFFEPLAKEFDLTAFASLTPYHDRFAFPVVKLPSPMDIPDFPYKMPVLNRLFVDAHYLVGLEEKLKGFDLVHTAETYFRYTQQALDAKKRGYVKKVIATVLETIPFNNEGIWGRKAYKARARKELDHIIALTAKAKEALIAEGADPGKITVLPHFIDTKRFVPAQTWLKKRLADHPLTILFVGRLEKEKGVWDVLEAYLRLLKETKITKNPPRLKIIGRGSQQAKLKAFAEKNGLDWHSIHESATYDEMPVVYRGADIFVAPSKPTPTWEEQYCTALLEAQASGLPIVTTETGGIPENVGDAAVLVAPGDVRAIANALKRFLLDRASRTSYAAKARERAVKVHDIAIGARKLASLYRHVMQEA